MEGIKVDSILETSPFKQTHNPLSDLLSKFRLTGHETNGDNCPVDGNIQENHIENNTGITGITGTGHTITINQCPQEFIEILSKLIEITNKWNMKKESNNQPGANNNSAELKQTERNAISIEERRIEKNSTKELSGEVIRITKGDKIYKAWQENRQSNYAGTILQYYGYIRK